MDGRREVLYEGKAKTVFLHRDPVFVIQHFKDAITAFNAERTDTLPGKGAINNRISYLLMQHLNKCGIDTHIVELLNENEQLVKKLSMLPIEVVIRNIAAGSFCKRFGVEKGTAISPPLLEFYYKNDNLSDPMISEDHIINFSLATSAEVAHIRASALQINQALRSVFDAIGIQLLDLKLEFGKHSGNIVLGDEISPDTCRLVDKSSGKVLDKDIYRLKLGDVLDGYREVLNRIEQHLGQ
ncbi:phosphoribosylaminoimidazolesuccinocarboxamide synthase [Anaplasma bovis]|uniref:phosphoribosylaminoimidazolesuccinocarboxamide synthase n=1 Tax=Anaplasma bovis TaxID=186733 RepID=UPI002FF41AFF